MQVKNGVNYEIFLRVKWGLCSKQEHRHVSAVGRKNYTFQTVYEKFMLAKKNLNALTTNIHENKLLFIILRF